MSESLRKCGSDVIILSVSNPSKLQVFSQVRLPVTWRFGLWDGRFIAPIFPFKHGVMFSIR